MSVGVMTVGVMSVGEITVGVMRRPQLYHSNQLKVSHLIKYLK
jgi:hypothetical protein